MTKQEQAEIVYLQIGLEAITDHALETGDKEAYSTPEYHQAKARLLTLVRNRQPAATNYGGGGPDGGHR